MNEAVRINKYLSEAGFCSRRQADKLIAEGRITVDGKVADMGQKVLPLEKVALYVPGGTAAYPSSVLMNGIPARLAGCPNILMTTPPGKDGKVNPRILAAADYVCWSRRQEHKPHTPSSIIRLKENGEVMIIRK